MALIAQSVCAECGIDDPVHWCSVCHTPFCEPECQQTAWSWHKRMCRRLFPGAIVRIVNGRSDRAKELNGVEGFAFEVKREGEVEKWVVVSFTEMTELQPVFGVREENLQVLPSARAWIVVPSLVPVVRTIVDPRKPSGVKYEFIPLDPNLPSRPSATASVNAVDEGLYEVAVLKGHGWTNPVRVDRSEEIASRFARFADLHAYRDADAIDNVPNVAISHMCGLKSFALRGPIAIFRTCTSPVRLKFTREIGLKEIRDTIDEFDKPQMFRKMLNWRHAIKT